MSIHPKYDDSSRQAGDPYQNLANGVVMQAAKDYIKAIREGYRKRDEKRHLERFFRSAWYKELTKVDPEWLIRKLQEEARRK